ERLEVDAVVGVGLAFLVIEHLDEQGAAVEVADPAAAVRQPQLRRPLLGVLLQRDEFRAEVPARVLEVEERPQGHGQVRREGSRRPWSRPSRWTGPWSGS